jgi:hypothetical protein
MYHDDISENMKWTPAQATLRIRAYGTHDGLSLWLTKHVRERLLERDLQTGDILHLLKFGHVLLDPKPATQPNLFKYELEGTTPNSFSRTLVAVVIPHLTAPNVKVVSIMWKDERS